MKTKTITTIMTMLFLVVMLNVIVVGATSTVESIEWLPPLTKHEESVFTVGSTLPIKFRLLDADGSFVMDPTVEVTVSSYPITLPFPLHNKGTQSVPRILADSTMLFTDYTFEADARCLSGKGCALIFRADDYNNLYSFQLDSGIIPLGGWRLRLSRFSDFTWPADYYDVADDVACPVFTEYGKWHHLKVEVVGAHIKCYIDGIPVFDVTDTKAPIISGGIGFRTWSYAQAEFDNVVVGVPEILFSDNFDDGNYDGWTPVINDDSWEVTIKSFSYDDGTIDVSESLYLCNLHTRELGMPTGDYIITAWLDSKSVQVGSHPFELVEPGRGKGKA